MSDAISLIRVGARCGFPDGDAVTDGHIRPVGWVKPVLCIFPDGGR